MPPNNKTPKQGSRNVNVPPLRMPGQNSGSSLTMPQSPTPTLTSPRQQSKVIRLMSSKESREASVSKDTLSKDTRKGSRAEPRTPASTSAREAEIAKLAEGLRAAEAAKKEREADRFHRNPRPLSKSDTQRSSHIETTTRESPGSRARHLPEGRSSSSKGKPDERPTSPRWESSDMMRDQQDERPWPLALVMKNLERSLEQGKSLYGGGHKGKGESRIGVSEEVNLCDFEDAPGEASLATMLEKLEKNFQTQKAMYKESMALLDDRDTSPPSPARKKHGSAEELVDVVEDLMNFAAPVDLNMPPLSSRPIQEPEWNTPAGRAKEHMKSFWKVLKDSVETSALCVLQNLYANWQASFLEAVQETMTKTNRLGQNACQGGVTQSPELRNSPRSTVPCSPGAADRLIDMINNHTQGVDRAIEGLLVRSGVGTEFPDGNEAYQNGHEVWHDAQAQAQIMHQYSPQSIFAEQRGRSMVTAMQSFDRSTSSDHQARLPTGQQNVLPYTIAHGQPIRSRSSAPSFFFEQTTISGQPRAHVYPPARGWNQGMPASPSLGTRGIPRSPLVSGAANCRSLTPSLSVCIPATTCSGPMPVVRSPAM